MAGNDVDVTACSVEDEGVCEPDECAGEGTEISADNGVRNDCDVDGGVESVDMDGE